MKKRFILLTIVLAAALLVLTGCGASPTDAAASASTSDLTVIGFSQVGAESDWRVANTESIRSTFSEENGYELIYSDAQQKQENQISAIRRFILQKVDYILLAPVTENGWDSVLQEAKEAGIPVILVDRMIHVSDESLYTAFVGSNCYQEGETAVTWLENDLEEEDRAQEALNILHICGTLNSTPQIGRSGALADGVSKHDNWNVIAQIEGDFTQAQSYESMQSLLSGGDDEVLLFDSEGNFIPDVIYCENDNMALGALQAMEEAGIDIVHSDLLVISFDATNAGLTACLRREIDLDVECDPLQGPMIASTIQQLRQGKPVEKHSFMETTWFEQKTLTQSVIDARAY